MKTKRHSYFQPDMAMFEKKSVIQLIIHLTVWAVIIAFPLLFSYEPGRNEFERHFRYLVPVLFSMLFFYINYSLLIKKYLFRQKIRMFLLINIILLIICVLAEHQIFIHLNPFDHARPKARMPHFPLGFLFLKNMLSMAFSAGTAVAIKMTGRWYQAESEKKDLIQANLESELSNLKSQINPHFLFNSLNNIYSLISINQDNARDALYRLSNLIRYILYEGENKIVPMSSELTFCRDYIDLMALRLGKHVKLEVNLQEPEKYFEIAPLLFISLIENAFKHGVSPDKDCFIRIQTDYKNDEAIFTIENSNFAKNGDDLSGNGIGLKNLKKRLDLIYPGSHELVLEDRNDTFFAQLKISL